MGPAIKLMLSKYSFFGRVAPSLQEEICGAAEFVQIPEGGVLIQAGCVCEEIVLLGKGSLRVFAHSNSGREVTLYRVSVGETCPINMMSVLLGKPAPATAVADTPLEMITLPAMQFQDWVDDEAEVRRFAIESLGDRMADIILLVEEMVLNHFDIRLANFLSSRFGVSSDRHPVINLSEKEIALQLGSSQHVVSRVLHDFALHGAIKIDQRGITLRQASLLSDIGTGRC
jgi:CRP/FNR family transcriptional regulator